MRRSFLASSIVAAIVFAQQPAHAADVTAIPAPPRAVIVEPAPVVVVPATTACWRYGGLGWGWYPCYAGPPGYHADRGWRPHWAGQHWLFYR